MSFEEYLIYKKIDSAAFKTAEPALWNEWLILFDQMNEKSFTAQKLYLINPLRRRFRLPEQAPTLTPTAPPVTNPVAPAVGKPKMFKPKIN